MRKSRGFAEQRVAVVERTALGCHRHSNRCCVVTAFGSTQRFFELLPESVRQGNAVGAGKDAQSMALQTAA